MTFASAKLRSGTNRGKDDMQPMPLRHDFDDSTQELWFSSGLASNRNKLVVVSIALLLAAAYVAVLCFNPGTDAKNSIRSNSNVLQLQCPEQVHHAENVDEEEYKEEYTRTSDGNLLLKSNVTAFLESFRKQGYDNWGHSYEELKKGLYHWKSTMYPDNLNEGDSIYESACGIGLNLYMTLEVVNEVKGLEKLVVYGNEYLKENAESANLLFDVAAPFHAKKGTICAGDSAHLEFIPSASFDLVFTGYLPTLNNPLGYDFGDFNTNWDYYIEACEGDDWKSKKLADLAQTKQNEWAARLVGEMIRIAKPGKAIIFEQITLPLCDALDDWGGVTREWWKESIGKYGWDVDPESIKMEDDSIFHRYHVFMRKN